MKVASRLDWMKVASSRIWMKVASRLDWMKVASSRIWMKVASRNPIEFELKPKS
jgi:hypothetical protein